MKIKLWYVDGACSLAVRICLNEARVPFEAVRMVMGKGGTQSDDFARINPKRSVPVISIDGEVITELPAILTAISLLAPEYALLGSTNLEIARTYEWLNWLSGTLQGRGYNSLWRPSRFSDDSATYDSISRKGRETIEECYSTIDLQLTRKFSVGTEFSSVDALLIVYYIWGNMVGIDMLKHRKYSQFVESLIERKSVIASFDAENVTINGPMSLPDLSS